MMKRARDLVADLLVAVEADRGLRRLVAHLVVRGVDLVAGGAGQVGVGVRPGLPVGARTTGVAGEAGPIALGGGSGRMHAEGARRRRPTGRALGLLMCVSLSPWQSVQVGVRESAITP
jgi:hypothetical protein